MRANRAGRPCPCHCVRRACNAAWFRSAVIQAAAAWSAVGLGSAREGHDGVADVLVHRAAGVQDVGAEGAEVIGQVQHQLLGPQLFGYGGEVGQVAEIDRQPPFLAAQLGLLSRG